LRFAKWRFTSRNLLFVGNCLRFAGGTFEDALAH